MKTLLTVLVAFALSSFASAAKEGWTDNLEKAKAQAKAENKKILLDFTGSDWCGWWKKLDSEVFSQPGVKENGAKKVVLVAGEFPQTFKTGPERKKQNDTLAAEDQNQSNPT